MNQDPFKECIKESEQNKRNKGYAWHTAIGLQAAVGLLHWKWAEGRKSFYEEYECIKTLLKIPITRILDEYLEKKPPNKKFVIEISEDTYYNIKAIWEGGMHLC